jgi:hypothetical protein
MLPARFEPAVPASERPQTHALDRAVTGISINAEQQHKDVWSVGWLVGWFVYCLVGWLVYMLPCVLGVKAMAHIN